MRCCTTDFLSAESDAHGGIIQGLVFDDNSGGEIIEEVVSGTAGSQVDFFASEVAKLEKCHPDAVNYQPGAIL